LLELLQERPMHGYEMIKTLQERTGGRYAASPGSVYPTLQMLEDRGFVRVSPSDGKKVYSITDDGRAFLAEGRGEHHHEHDFWHGPNQEWPEVSALWQELRACGPLLMSALRSARHDPDKLRRLKQLVERIRGELSEIAGTSSQYDA
jgi:DNA-binding PadR family transcriptional regulator